MATNGSDEDKGISSAESEVEKKDSGQCSLMKILKEKRARAKKVKFYRNGDRFFNGFLYVISTERVRSFDSLLEDLTRALTDKVNIPKGVRFIFTIDGKDKITCLEQFVDGCSYVCSSTDHYIKIDYLKNEKPNWVVKKKLETDNNRTESNEHSRQSREFIKPKIIIIIRSGLKPRKCFRILLNKKTAHSFDQVLTDITSTIKLDTGAVRKVFTLSGQEVTALPEFFSQDDIFIAFGTEKPVADDFLLDSEESRSVNQLTRNISTKRSVQRSSEALNIKNVMSRRRVSTPFDDSLEESSRGSFSTSPLLRSSNVRPLSRTGQDYHNGHSMSDIPKEIKKKYDIIKVIGEGNFAVVYECVDKITKFEYAIKVIDKKRCKGKEEMIHNEVHILRRVSHMNIVQLIEEYDFKNDLYLVMELVKGGDLFDAISSATRFSEETASRMIHDLSRALHYLHSINIVHRDIKPENLLVVEYGSGIKSLKLGDFGLAVEATEPLFIVCGTPTYVAPEILQESGYGVKVDIWAAGVILYILLCGYPPFVRIPSDIFLLTHPRLKCAMQLDKFTDQNQNNDQVELFDEILAGRYEFGSPYWDNISENAKDLIRNMLQVDANERFSAFDVLTHPWVQTNSYDVECAVSKELNNLKRDSKSSLKVAGIALIANENSVHLEEACHIMKN